MNFKKILIVAAHPDDDILGCGGTIAKYSSQQDIHFRIIFIAEGSTCRYSYDKIESIEALKEIKKRNTCAKSSLAVLNISDYKFYNLPCGRLDKTPLIDLGKIVENEIKAYQPDTIFTHSHRDVNNDHKLVFQAVLQATRPGAQNLVKRVYSFEILSSSEWGFIKNFKPNFFVSLDLEHVTAKTNALNEYTTEIKDFPFPRSSEGILTLAKRRGMQSASHYAEAFQLIREII
ncbi:PIG-L family deacetylase [Desulfobacula sp.]|uniref:PIG-L deacetylase family protein n=1 Tax=Desulfobacula sp. TaxID=2593537 RepID=UPI00260C6E4D|nr:PIG-L family deacetylase [Desulfobacula sp.]